MVNPLGAVFPVVNHQQPACDGEHCSGQSVVEPPTGYPHPLLIPVPFHHCPDLFLASTPVRKLLEREARFDDYLSAFPLTGISDSYISKAIFVIVAAVLLAFATGCGGEERRPTTATPPTAAPAPSSEGSSDPVTANASEGRDLAPVDLELDNGGFASKTPKTFHVPSGFLVLVTAKNVSDATIRLSISAPSLAQTWKVGPGRTQTVTLASIGEGESARMISGGQTIRIAADAEPGP